MSDRFTLAFVPGVTPSKWVGIWKERMPRIPFDLLPASHDEALRSLVEGGANVALVRLPVAGEGWNVIPLYSEVTVVVAAKDHALGAFDSLTLADLADQPLAAGECADTVEFVAATDQIALMPHSLARLYNRRDVISRPVMDAPESRVALVWLASETTPWIEEFVGIVRGRTANSSRGKR